MGLQMVLVEVQMETQMEIRAEIQMVPKRGLVIQIRSVLIIAQVIHQVLTVIPLVLFWKIFPEWLTVLVHHNH